MVDGADDQMRWPRLGPDGGQSHVLEMRAPEVEVAQHDEIGAGSNRATSATRVRQQRAPVEESGLSLAAAARGVDEHRGQERDRGVEVQQCGDRDDGERVAA